MEIRKTKKHQQKTADKVKANDTDKQAIVVTYPDVSSKKTTPDLQQYEDISASCDNKLIITKTPPALANIDEEKPEYALSLSTFKTEFKKGAKRIKENAKVTSASMNGLALAGFICSLVGLILFGLVLGVVAIILSSIGLSRINKDPLGWNGKGLAIAGIIIGILDIIGWIIFLAIVL